MTEQEIRDNAPDGAERYRVGLFGVCYFKKTERGIEMWNWNSWIKTGHDTESFLSFKPL